MGIAQALYAQHGKDLKKRLMEDPELREAYAQADDEFALIEALVRARMAAKLTQAQLARRLGTTQSAFPGRVPTA